MPRIRTIKQAHTELKANDPNTALTEHSIRQLILTGQLPAFQSGNKYLVDLDVLETHLQNIPSLQAVPAYGNIRPINIKAR